MKVNARSVYLLLSVLVLGGLVSSARADGTEMLDTPTIPIQPGTGIRAAGVGLADGQPGAITINIPAGATVKQAILYWEGANALPGDLTPTDTIDVSGNPVTGDFIGGDTLYSAAYRTVTYREDITGLGLIGPGSSTIMISGLSFTTENNGAGLMVIYDDGSPESEIDLRDGNDFAMIDWPVPLDRTELQTFDFDPADGPRLGTVEMFVGSVADDTGTYGFRPSSFEVTTDGVTAVFSDQLNSMDGRYWDTVTSLVVTIPAGADSLSVEIFSRDDGVVAPGNLPASLVWVASGFSVQTVDEDLCWITTGGFHNDGEQGGSKNYTFGGNVGPPPRGSWEVIDHNTGDNFHSNDVHITSCEVVRRTGPGQPGGKKGFKINRADFAGTGRLNHVDGFPFTGYVLDGGEPHGNGHGNHSNDPDYFEITVRDPDTNAIVFHAGADLDGGNVQIHPPTGNGNN